MLTDKQKTQFRSQAKRATDILITSPFETDYDKLLFSEQYDNVVNGLNVKFTDTDDKDVLSLRAARLKMLGYTFERKSISWIAGGRGKGCQW